MPWNYDIVGAIFEVDNVCCICFGALDILPHEGGYAYSVPYRFQHFFFFIGVDALILGTPSKILVYIARRHIAAEY